MLADVLPDETPRADDVYRRHLAAFQEVDRQIAIALCLLPGPDDPGLVVNRTRGLGPRSVVIVTALFAKQIKTTRAIVRVAAGGLGEDAMTLVRVHFETMVAIAWILQKSSRLRTNLYLAYRIVNGLKVLGKWKATKGLKRKAPKHVVGSYATQLAEKAATLRMTPEALTKTVKSHWSGLGSLEEVLKRLRSSGTYQVLYRFASPFNHAADALQHLEMDGVLRVVPADKHVLLVLRTASYQMWWSTNRLNDRFGLGRDAEIAAAKPTLVADHEAKRTRRKRPSTT